jgi:hypothetical protein
MHEAKAGGDDSKAAESAASADENKGDSKRITSAAAGAAGSDAALSHPLRNSQWDQVNDFKWLRKQQSPHWSVLPADKRMASVTVPAGAASAAAGGATGAAAGASKPGSASS